MPSPTTTFGDLRNAKAGQARRRCIPSVAPPPELQDWLRTFQVGTEPCRRVHRGWHHEAAGLKGSTRGAEPCRVCLCAACCRWGFWVPWWSFSEFLPLAKGTQM